MSSAMMMERTGMVMPGMGVPGMGSPATGPAGMSYLMVPRCTFKVEKSPDGIKVHCVCEDQTAASMVQNLCTMLAGGLCSCCVSYNGVTVCSYNFTMGTCKWEPTSGGCTFSCTSGDPKCCAMLQSYCDCLSSMMSAGCHCCFYVNGTPLCWGCSETSTSKPASKR